MPSDDDVVIRAQAIHKHFGGLRAVDGMDLTIRRGTLTGIIGPNGAGKSTFFNVLAGAIPATSGRIFLRGHDVTRMPAYRRARAGLARTFQHSRPLRRLSVAENLRLAPPGRVGERWWAPLVAPWRMRAEDEALKPRIEATLRFFELYELRDEYAGALSGGQKKLLELARALLTDPTVVLLDEPMAGVNPTLARRLLEKIDTLRRERGLTFVLVEHDLETVFTRCDPIVVMANGKRLAEGSAEEIRANPAVVDAYLGA